MRKINRSAISGFISCFGMILIGIATNGGIKTIFNFIHIPSMIITFGGAVFAVLISVESMDEFVDGFKGFKLAFSKENTGLDEIGDTLYELSLISRKEGLLALEEKTQQMSDEFMAKGIRLMVDGTDAELLKDMLEIELLHEADENRRRVAFWENMGAYAPAWGMVGTLLGLINMMKGMGNDSSAIGAGMSLALITTLYGSVLANWVCIPIAAKLKRSSRLKELQKELIVEGVLSIQAGESPMVIKEKIRTYRADWNEKNLGE